MHLFLKAKLFEHLKKCDVRSAVKVIVTLYSETAEIEG